MSPGAIATLLFLPLAQMVNARNKEITQGNNVLPKDVDGRDKLGQDYC
jgi:hypothetical protein